MKKFLMGLSLACLFVGCGDTATEPATEEKKDASTDTAAATENVAATETEEPAAGEDVAAAEEPAEEAASAELVTVKFKVPGMT